MRVLWQLERFVLKSLSFKQISLKIFGLSKLKVYLCSTRIRHASHRTAYQGGTFFIYTFMDYTNSPLEVPALIQTLKDRGLSITDDNKALAFLENVSYFRFRTYLRPMEQDKVMHQ